jgi:hypothetical protein
MSSKTKAVGMGVLAAGGATLVVWSSCGTLKQEPVASPRTSEPPAVISAAPVRPSGSAAPATADGESPLAGPGAVGLDEEEVDEAAMPRDEDGRRPGEQPPSNIVRVMSAIDPKDRAFVRRIEREFKRDPPIEVDVMIARRKQGATRDELTRLARELPDRELRGLALWWVAIHFAGSGARAKPAAPASAAPLVTPVTPVR